MRRLILQTGISIDGYVAALDKWHLGRREGGRGCQALDPRLGVGRGRSLDVRVTYEVMAAVWPRSTSEYARPMNEIPKVVFSKSLQHADRPETRIARATSAKRSGVSSANRAAT
jgi:hypothetical protein